jgi:caffeoyl-CoA O-methyltransferase
LGQGSCDLLFLDAIKTEYPGYLDAGLPLMRSGGLIVADNVLGAGDGWIPDSIDDEPSRVAIDQFNRRVSDHPRLQGTILPMRQGLLVARVL